MPDQSGFPFWPYMAQFAVTVGSGALVAYLSVHLSLRRFYSERWWERKAEAYKAILNSLHDLAEEIEAFLAESMHETELSETRKNTLREAAKRGHEEVKKQARIGSFIISNEAEKVLTDLQKELSSAGKETMSWHEYLDDSYVALSKATKAMKNAAKSDLKLR